MSSGGTPKDLAGAAILFRNPPRILADEPHRGEVRLQAALSQAGATLHHVIDAGEAYRVMYAVDGAQHTSVVRK